MHFSHRFQAASIFTIDLISYFSVDHHITMKIHIPPLLLLLSTYAIDARFIADDHGTPVSQPPVNMFEPEPESDRFIVGYKNRKGKKSSAQAAAGKVHADLGPQNAIAVTLSTEALERLQNNPNIEYVEQDSPRYPMMMRGSHLHDVFKEQPMRHNETHGENHRKLSETVPYGIAMVQADRLSYNYSSSSRRTICIIDSGYNLGHEDLPSSLISGQEGSSWNTDSCMHGTHVAGKYGRK
jgi:subtilisin family serine protease